MQIAFTSAGSPFGGYLTAEQRLDDQLLSALWVFDRAHTHADRQILRTVSLEFSYRIRLVRLHSDYCLCGAGCTQQVSDACEYIGGLLQHDAVVGGQVGLALDAIDDEGVQLFSLRRFEFYMGRKRGAAEADNARSLDRHNDLVGRGSLHVTGFAVGGFL